MPCLNMWRLDAPYEVNTWQIEICRHYSLGSMTGWFLEGCKYKNGWIMHRDIKESDGLCGSTRQSLSGQLNIWMHAVWNGAPITICISASFFFNSFSKAVIILEKPVCSFFCRCMQASCFLSTNDNNGRFPFVALNSIYKNTRLSFTNTNVWYPYTFLPIQAL